MIALLDGLHPWSGPFMSVRAYEGAPIDVAPISMPLLEGSGGAMGLLAVWAMMDPGDESSHAITVGLRSDSSARVLRRAW